MFFQFTVNFDDLFSKAGRHSLVFAGGRHMEFLAAIPKCSSWFEALDKTWVSVV